MVRVSALLAVATAGILAAFVVGLVGCGGGLGYAQFTANKGACLSNLALIRKISEILHVVPDSPIGDKWIEGFQYTDDEVGYATACDSLAQKSRLAFWRLLADPAITEPGLTVGGPSVFLCPGSTAPKAPAILRSGGAANRDFPDPKKNLFYSMFNQDPDTADMVPSYGTRPEFVIMADRSPQDDGHPLGGNSANHRWGGENTGQNVVFSSGQAKWVERTDIGIDEDEIYAKGKDTAAPITADTRPDDEYDTILMPVGL